MGHAQRQDERHTVVECLRWGKEVPHCELIDGLLYDMVVPTVEHQHLLARPQRPLPRPGNFGAGRAADLAGRCRLYPDPVGCVQLAVCH